MDCSNTLLREQRFMTSVWWDLIAVWVSRLVLYVVRTTSNVVVTFKYNSLITGKTCNSSLMFSAMSWCFIFITCSHLLKAVIYLTGHFRQHRFDISSSRNLLKIPANERNGKRIHYGKQAVIRFYTDEFPKTKHLLETLNVDIVFQNVSEVEIIKGALTSFWVICKLTEAEI